MILQMGLLKNKLIYLFYHKKFFNTMLFVKNYVIYLMKIIDLCIALWYNLNVTLSELLTHISESAIKFHQ